MLVFSQNNSKKIARRWDISEGLVLKTFANI